MVILLSLLCVALITAVVLLASNRVELLDKATEKDGIIDANTRAITLLEGKWQLAILAAQENEKKVKELQELFDKEKERNTTVLSQKKSTEVKLGAIAENALPLLQNIPYDATNLRHLGQPVDFIYFSYNEADPGIYIIEVKSQNAKESKRQKLIKNFVKTGKVYYEVVRIDEKGITIKRENNNE